MLKKIGAILIGFLLASCTGTNSLVLNSEGNHFLFNENGELINIELKDGTLPKEIHLINSLSGSEIISVSIEKSKPSEIVFRKRIKRSTGGELEFLETYKAADGGLECKITIVDEGEFWSAPVCTSLSYKEDGTKFWTAWADPRGAEIEARPDNVLIANAIIPEDNVGGNWSDPLMTMPFTEALWYYGAPDYQYDDPGLVYCPFQGDVFCIPMASFINEDEAFGMSIVLSHRDLILDMHMNTRKEGSVEFSRFNHRLGEGRELTFTYNIVLHEADWRPALDWVSSMYPEYYNPVCAHADTVVGTAAYSNHWVDFDAEKLRKMAFKVNWRASFDFPYMGQFLPPVETGVEWNSFLRARHIGIRKPWKTSIPFMEDYAARMNEYGFNVLSYFNVTEFGTQVTYPEPPRKEQDEKDYWKNSDDYLYGFLSDAMLFVPDSQIAVLDIGQYSVRPGEPFWTWERAVAMDPGEPVYQDHLIKQAQRHVKEIPSSSGICIDRMDWLRFYNHKRDDGVSWFGNQAVRSLNVSWNDLMSKLDTVFHKHNKLIYVNNHTKRIEHLRYVDGILDEFTYAGAPLNTIALMTVRKPCMGWMSSEDQLKPDPDAFIQKYLYLGVFPMAPYPGNDHSMQPGPLADEVYLDYGPLFKMMTGKKWVLEAHVISVTDDRAKANIYESFDGLSIPVVYGGDHESVEVVVRKSELQNKKLKITALQPGEEVAIDVEWKQDGEALLLNVPLKRSCAMVSIVELD